MLMESRASIIAVAISLLRFADSEVTLQAYDIRAHVRPGGRARPQVSNGGLRCLQWRLRCITQQFDVCLLLPRQIRWPRRIAG
jgi:hypothetical protein